MRYLIVILMLFCAPLHAQQNDPRLEVEVDGKIEAIRISRIDADVKILGEVAETRMTLTFHNSHSRQLEGNLVFPLPEGVTISGYALDVNGVMVDGVVVEKYQGRRIFEKEERKRIDPGLVEWVKGNNFQTRIYPIPADGGRTIMVRYISQLSRTSGQATYYLPLNMPERLDQFHLRVEVVRAAAMPRMAKGSFGEIQFNAWNESYVLETSQTDVTLNKDLVIEIPGVEKIPVWVEKNGDDTYFVINDFQADSTAPGRRIPKPPKKIAIFWDASGSRGHKDHQRELNLLKMLFERWNKAKVEVELILFRNSSEPSHRFLVLRGNANKLLEELRTVVYDGGTQIFAISRSVADIIPDYYLLFTDGISNFGQVTPSGFKAPLYSISADPISNHSFLSWLATTTGGQYFNLSELDDKTVLKNIGLPAYQFMRAQYDPASIMETFPRNPEPIQGRFTLTGKLLVPSAEILLEFGIGDRVHKVVKYTVKQENVSSGNLLPIFWAQKKIKELSVFPENNQKELIAIGKRHGLVTPGTSLLVLETLGQYVQYKIEPPASLPELRKEYLDRIAEGTDADIESKTDKIDSILAAWNKRVKWWETDFSAITVKPAEKATPNPSPTRSTPERRVIQEQQEEARVAAKPPTARSQIPKNGHSVIYGTATDATGAVLPGASITVIDEEAGAESKTVTTNAGNYNLDGLPQGRYKVVAEMPGFHTRTIVDVRLGATSRFPLNFELAVAGVATQVEVVTSAASYVLESASSTGTVLEDSKDLEAIAISGWNPETPYLKELEKATPDQYMQVYLKNREANGDSPAFFLDCADFFLKHDQSEIGLRILSNIAELRLEDPAFLRILAHWLGEMGETQLSAQLFESILRMRPEEPQSYRDLALILAEQKKYARAMELLNHVVMNRWDRFDGIEVIALMELNRIIPLARAQGVAEVPLDVRLVKLLDADIRVVLTWDADLTDIDLWVTEPSGEKAFYGATLTRYGGLVSTDFTQGYGPEEYIIHHAKPGKYLIQANYYGSDSTSLRGPVTVQADVYTNYGRQNEKRQRLTIRLKEEKDTYIIGEITF